MELLKDPKRLEAAKTFLMVPLWGDRPFDDIPRLRAWCEHCGAEVAWQPECAEQMEALKTHLLCPDCTRLMLRTFRGTIESLGVMDKGKIIR